MSRDASVSKLREHIDKLSSGIQALIDQRAKGYRELNYLLDPMARLPLELQSQIFLYVEHRSWDCKADPRDVPMVFLNVCHLWRVIALSTPNLWTEIKIDSLPCSTNYIALYKNWMERAGRLPLSLSLQGFLGPEDTEFHDLVDRHRHQVKRLTLHWSLKDRRASDSAPVRLEGLFPSLKKLALYARDDALYDADEVLDVLRATPNVSHCELAQVFYDQEYDLVTEDELLELSDLPLILSSLEDLQLGDAQLYTYLGHSGSGCAILRYLCLPALKKLSLTVLNIEDVISFFTRSSPPLESLFMTLESVWTESLVHQCLRLLPTLTELDLSARLLPFTIFVEALGTSPTLLPNLRALSLGAFYTAKIDYNAILQMLNARRSTNLEKLSVYLQPLEWDDDARPAGPPVRSTALPDAEAKLALQQFVKEGMKIDVGPVDRNVLTEE
ncbi:hypothetical protein R3P38DRAFT_2960737 [Favolaschia claudopus]|uniref:F-box domain-containing protein n=1 Tax=Favolaschia claudopus TaxID=2862362 RepID=A0AAW0B9Z3_9AGAR